MPKEIRLPLSEYVEKIEEFWRLLSPAQQEHFLTHATLLSYKKNELIYQEGENPDHLLCIVSGKIKIYRDGIGGRSQILYVLRPGQYFGYRASMAAEPYLTAAAAFEPSILCTLPMSVVNSIMAENTDLCHFFIRDLAQNMGFSDKRLVSLTQKHVRGRLAESLLYLKEVYGVDATVGRLSIHLTREDLANLSNMTTSNAIRTLSDFAEENIVQINGKDIVILDEEKLTRISGFG